MVKTTFCTGTVAEENTSTTDCKSYTKKRYAYIPSIMDVNMAQEGNNNFMTTITMSWVSNKKDKSNAYLTRKYFFGDFVTKTFLPYDISENYGIRPKIVIKGGSLITGGEGTQEKPYTFGETKKAKGGEKLNTRYSGEYITTDGYLFRIIEVEEDGTTKVVSNDTLGTINDRPMTYSNPTSTTITYNIKDKENYGYYINNQASKYIDVSLFVTHDVEVPYYKNKIIYKEEKKTETIRVKVSPPNMYDMFSAQVNRIAHTSHSYWLINSSESKDRIVGAIQDIGVPKNESLYPYEKFGVKVVGYVNSSAVIVSGNGTYNSPYKLG